MKTLFSDAMKHRRTWVMPLTLLGPTGVILMGIIDFGLRREWLARGIVRSGEWLTVMNQLGMLEVAAIALGVTLLTSMVFDVDHRSGAWKQLFALPVSRTGAYLVKIAIVMGLMSTASVLAAAGVAGIWAWLQLGPVPWGRIALLAVVPAVAALPLVAWQALLSAHIRHQAVALTAGVAGVIAALFGARLPEWAPWAAPVDSMAWLSTLDGEPVRTLVVGCLVGVALAVGGACAFAMRDVM